MPDTLSSPSPNVPEVWVSLAAACAITRRQDATVKGWIAAQELGPTEAKQLENRRGPGRAWAIWLPALYAVHSAHGGYYWAPDAALAGNVPPQVAEELTRLRTENARLQAEVTTLRRQLDALRNTPLPATPVAGLARRDREVEPSHGRGIRAQGEGVWTLPPLPGGYVALSSLAARHGFGGSRSSVYRHKTELQRYVYQGPWCSSQGREIVNAVDASGCEAFGRIFARHRYFTACHEPDCATCRAAGYGGYGRQKREEREQVEQVEQVEPEEPEEPEERSHDRDRDGWDQGATHPLAVVGQSGPER